VFGRCLARSVAGVLAETHGDVVEFGAGSGALAATLVPALSALGAAPARYRIVEVSADLRERQRALLAERLPDWMDRIEWLDAPPADAWRGALIANEVADALPVERIRIVDGGIEQAGVVAGEAGFTLEWREPSTALAAAFASVVRELPETLAIGHVTDFAPAAGAWLATALAGCVQGAAYVVDYGLPRAQYHHASRDGGSLCGFFRHRRHEDPFLHPGLSDLTAWVDFTTLAEASLACGFEVAGFTTQAHFLADTGLDEEFAAEAERLDERGRVALAHAVGQLMLPGEMGEKFKVLVLARGLSVTPAGFGLRDLAATL